MYPQKQLIGSMCSGSLLLEQKIANRQKATTYPSAVEQLKEFGVDVIKKFRKRRKHFNCCGLFCCSRTLSLDYKNSN